MNSTAKILLILTVLCFSLGATSVLAMDPEKANKTPVRLAKESFTDMDLSPAAEVREQALESGISTAFNPIVIIPARLAATRLPNKPLEDICGKPMIIHVWERAREANVGPVLVACADQKILDIVTAYGGTGILTDPALPSGTDRVKAALDVYDPEGNYDPVINVQGDLPTLEPTLVRQALEPFENPAVDIATLATLIDDRHELANPNIVKISLSLQAGASIGQAFDFNRVPFPSEDGLHYHHIGLYAYRRESLNKFVSLPVSPLEKSKKLEQLRALENGMRIDVKVVTTSAPIGVDTLDDLEKARSILGEEAKSFSTLVIPIPCHAELVSASHGQRDCMSSHFSL